jgi:hypothetical protein
MRKLAALAGAVALAGGLAACSSSGSSSSTSTATPKPTATTGAETFSGTVTGKAAVANSSTFALTFSGPVATTGTQTLSGNGPKKGQHHTFPTKAGNLVAVVSGSVVNSQKLLSTTTCRFEYSTVVPFTVDGAASTGKFAGSSGKGVVTVLFTADLPKLSSGKCNTSNNAQPLAAAAVGTFKGVATLTVKQ